MTASGRRASDFPAVPYGRELHLRLSSYFKPIVYLNAKLANSGPLALYVPAKAGRLASSWSGDRSVSLLFAALCGADKPLHPDQSISPSRPQCTPTDRWINAATWLPCS